MTFEPWSLEFVVELIGALENGPKSNIQLSSDRIHYEVIKWNSDFEVKMAAAWELTSSYCRRLSIRQKIITWSKLNRAVDYFRGCRSFVRVNAERVPSNKLLLSVPKLFTIHKYHRHIYENYDVYIKFCSVKYTPFIIC